MGRANLAEESNAQLLRRFADERDECAFACLVSRHAKLVLGVCRRMLRNRQDTEDAFQVVMLTMAAKSRSLKNVRSLSGWLHGVSVRASLNLRRMNRRWRRASTKCQQSVMVVMDDGQSAELIGKLDEELAKLSDSYRDVLVLCDLEGLTRDEAARQLKLPPGTVASRLIRGRKLLRTALERRGVMIAVGGGIVGTLSQVAESARAASPELIQTTVHSAMLLVAGKPLAFAASERIATLIHEMKKTMMIAKLKTVSSLFILAVAISAAAPAVTSSIGLSGDAARAETIFLDDFNDGSVINDTPLMANGTPVRWAVGSQFPSTTYEVSDGDLRVSSSQLNTTGLLYAVDNLIRGDVSIRAQFRLENGVADQSPGLFVRGDTATITGYWTAIDSDGGLWVGRGDGTVVREPMETGLRPTEEDLLLQLDVMDDTIEIWAWRVGEPMPAEPLVTRVGVGLTSGAVGVFYGGSLLQPEPNGTAVFRWVHVSTTHIPEPSTSTLCGIAALALGIWRWPRLSRP